jgi:hypothetical protein
MRQFTIVLGAIGVSLMGSVAAQAGCVSDRSYCKSECSGPLSTPSLFEGLGGGPNLFSVLSHGDCESDCDKKYAVCRKKDEDQLALPSETKRSDTGDNPACSVEFFQQNPMQREAN